MAGEFSDPLEALSAELESLAFGLGVSHMAVLPDECPRCHGRRSVGPELLPLACPVCVAPFPVVSEDG